ncbi:MAG: hypothetical protein ACYC2T_03250 [Bacillota bacterium]
MELALNLTNSPQDDSLKRLEEYRKWLYYLNWLGVKVEKPKHLRQQDETWQNK